MNSASRLSLGLSSSRSQTVEHEIDDVAAVAPGVRVVGLDDVAEQQRGPAVGVAELDGVVDPTPSLSREEPDQPEQRQGQQEGVGAIGEGRVGDEQPEGSEREVDEVRKPDGREMRPDADPEGRRAGRRAAEIEGELRHERRREERPVEAPVGSRAAGGDQHEGRAERVPAVRDEDDRPLQVPLPAEVLGHPAEQEAGGDQEGCDARRDEEEHRHEHELRRDREPDSDLEPHARRERVGHHEGRDEERRRGARRVGEERERNGDREKASGRDRRNDEVTSDEARGGALSRRLDQLDGFEIGRRLSRARGRSCHSSRHLS